MTRRWAAWAVVVGFVIVVVATLLTLSAAQAGPSEFVASRELRVVEMPHDRSGAEKPPAAEVELGTSLVAEDPCAVQEPSLAQAFQVATAGRVRVYGKVTMSGEGLRGCQVEVSVVEPRWAGTEVARAGSETTIDGRWECFVDVPPRPMEIGCRVVGKGYAGPVWTEVLSPTDREIGPVPLTAVRLEASVYGVVRDGDGSPIGGVIISSFEAIVSADDGSYEIGTPVGYGVIPISLRRDGFATAIERVAISSDERRLRRDVVLRPEVRCCGVVRSRSGPIAGAVLKMWAPPRQYSASSDATGRFCIHGIESLWSRSVVASAAGFVPASVTPTMREDGTVEMDIVMERGLALRGVVLDTLGEPVCGAEVYVKQRGHVTKILTCRDGSFECNEACLGPCAIEVRRAGFRKASAEIAVSAEGSPVVSMVVARFAR